MYILLLRGVEYIMTTTVQKWGNSNGIRIPKVILEDTLIKLNDEVEIIAADDKIIIKKVESRKHITLAERFKDYTGDYKCEEADWGELVGKEVW